MTNWVPRTIDDSITRFGSGLVHVAEGDYLGGLIKVSPSPENLDYSERDPYFAFDFRLEEGPDGLGKTLRYIGMFSQAKPDGSGGAWGLGRVLAALGADPAGLIGTNLDSYAKFAALAARLDKALSGKVKSGMEVADDTYSGHNNQTSIISRITGFFPAEEWALRSKPRTTPSATATAPAKPVASAPAGNGSANGTAPTPPSVASPAEGVTVDSMDESNLDEEIKKLFAATPA